MTNRPVLELTLITAFAVSAAAPLVAQGRMGFQPLLMDVADADGNGIVSSAEWNAYASALAANERGTLDAMAIKAGILAHQLDVDGDGELTRADLSSAFALMDADANGSLEPSETRFDGGPARSAARQGGFAAFLARGVLAQAADKNTDGTVDAEEWSAFESASIDDTAVGAWILAAEQAPGGRSAFTPGVFLLTLNSNLDADRNGRLTRADLEVAFATLDTNGDGAVDASERSASPASARPQRSRGEARAASEPGDSPLMPWQRNLEDALVLARKTGKPLLVCVNMDGEAASESLAARRYRNPEFAALADRFIPILASPDRHDARSHDDRGRRLPDSKFGRVLDQEHIDIEPALFERFFQGRRVAPRHVGVSPKGEILFDLYLLNDLSVIDATLREHGVTNPEDAVEPRTEAELLESPDAEHRARLEASFVEGNEATRARLASLALSDVRPVQHPELLWLALHDPSSAVRRQGVWTLVRHIEAAPLDLVPRAFLIADEEPRLYDALVRSMSEVAETSREADRRARSARLARVFSGLRERPITIDLERWRLAVAVASTAREAPLTGAQESEITKHMAAIDQRLTESPDDLQLNLLFAAATMRLARIHLQDGRNPSFLLEDVRAAAARASSNTSPSGAALAYLAWSSWLLSEVEAAGQYAAEALPHLLNEAGSPLASEVLNVHAQVRMRALYAALGDGSEAWSAQDVAEIAAAFEVLLEHPVATERHATEYLGFLSTIEAYAAQARVARRALERFPLALELHATLRAQTLRDGGAAGLEQAYGPVRISPANEATFEWFSGLAAFLAAEHRVTNRETAPALETYTLAIDRFETSIEMSPGFEGSAQHYICLAHAGRARLLTTSSAWDEAEREVLSALENENARETRDGLGKTAVQSARELLRALRGAGESERGEALAERLAALGVSARGGGDR